MQPRILALRAISSVYVLEILRPIAFATIGVLILISGSILYLSIFWSAWWLIFLVVFTVVSFAIVIAVFTALSIARTVAPIMDKRQHDAALSYVKNMHEVNESINTPQFLIVFKIIVDLFKRRWQGGFIQTTTTNSVKLKKDFETLTALFS